MPDDTPERWLPVVGYEGFYKVSDKGRVRRIRQARGATDGRILKPNIGTTGYFRVNLHAAPRRPRVIKIHQLVTTAFIGPCPEGKEVAHDDGNPENNAVTNLKYKTKSDNALDMIRHGTHNMARKTHCKHGHEFTPENTFIQKGNPKWRGCVQCKKDRSRARKLAA